MIPIGTPCSLHKKRNICLDLIKLLAAYFVVLIHFPFPGSFGDAILDLGRFAVPLFFLVSGFYACTSSPEKILKKLVYILKLYFVVALIYLIYKFICEAFIKGTFSDGLVYLKGYLDIKTLTRFFLFNVTRSSGHLWFMPALLYCYGIFYLSKKIRLSEKVLFPIAGILLLSCFVLEEGLALFGESISPTYTRNFLFTGFPFFTLGLLTFKHQESLSVCPTGLLITFAVLGLIESSLSGALLERSDLYIGSATTAISLLILGLKGKSLSFPPFLTLLSKIGTPLYLWHCLIGESFVLPGIKGVLEQIPHWDILNPGITCILSTCLALLIHKITHKGENPCGKQ